MYSFSEDAIRIVKCQDSFKNFVLAILILSIKQGFNRISLTDLD